MLKSIFIEERPTVVIHLAAQAGVRYSIDNPRSYLESNIIGTFELLEAAKETPPNHMLIASTSSVYGANKRCHIANLIKQIIKCHFTLRQKNQLKICVIAIHIYTTFQLQYLDFYCLWTMGSS